MIDRTDFLNPVVKEKKNFEQKTIDRYVAAGLNKGIDVLPPRNMTNWTGVD
jgi:recyclin-1